MVNMKVKHFRNAIIVVNICLVVIVSISAWYIKLYYLLENKQQFMGYVLDIDKFSLALTLGSSSLAITLIYLIAEYLRLTRLEMELSLTKISNEKAYNTINILQLHEQNFLNQLQALFAYLQMGKVKEAIRYIKDSIKKELIIIGNICNLDASEIAMLLFRKKEEALKNGIKINFQIDTDLSNICINQKDLASIISSLIDNAVYNLKKSFHDKSLEKFINVTFSYNKVNKTYIIEVYQFPGIFKSDDIIYEYNLIINKNQELELNLNIIKNLVEEKYHGKFEIYSKENLGACVRIAV